MRSSTKISRRKKKSRKLLKRVLKTLGKDYQCWLVVVGWAIFVLLLTGYFYLSSLKEYSKVIKNSSSPLVSMNRSTKGWVEIDYSNGKKRAFVADFYQEFSLATVLDASFSSSKLKLITKKGVIESIGDVKGRWIIYKNKKFVGSKLDNLTIKGGDKYTIKREK